MLEAFFSSIEECARLRSGSAGRHLDDFAGYLSRSKYRQLGGRRLLHAAAHFGSWAESNGTPLAALDGLALKRFWGHLSSCHCVGPTGGRRKSGRSGSRLFFRYLIRCGVVSEQEDDAPDLPPIVQAFRDWMVVHRGVTEVTLRDYGERIVPLLNALGDDPSCFQAQNLRSFVRSYAGEHRIKTTKYMISVIRMFLRFSAAEGKCAAGLEYAIPTFANWHLSNLPRYLPASDVEKVVAACDDSTEVGARDRAIMLFFVATRASLRRHSRTSTERHRLDQGQLRGFRQEYSGE